MRPAAATSSNPADTQARAVAANPSPGLPANELVLLRTLRQAAYVFLLLGRLDRPTGAYEVASLLDLHPETARKRLSNLKLLGLALRKRHRRGYELSAAGRRFLTPKSTQDRATGAIVNVNQSINDQHQDK